MAFILSRERPKWIIMQVTALTHTRLNITRTKADILQHPFKGHACRAGARLSCLATAMGQLW